ncbi:MAG: hypothetical protein M3Y27_14075 [Acidobacteriota bacterium]|nr:hypothetical protein [Acidobacteriota bacterium]
MHKLTSDYFCNFQGLVTFLFYKISYNSSFNLISVMRDFVNVDVYAVDITDESLTVI